MKYSQKVLNHFRNPQNIGVFDKTTEDIGIGHVGSVAAGEIIHLEIKMKNKQIIDSRIKVYGGVATIAAASWLSEWVKNKTLEDASKLNFHKIVDELELPNLKSHCAVLAEDALKEAIKNLQH